MSSMKKNLIKSFVFTIVYALATIAISYIKEHKAVLEILSERWYEYLILLFVIIWFNSFIDKKNKKINKNRFYKDL